MPTPRRSLLALAATLLAAGVSHAQAPQWVTVRGHVTLPPTKAPADTQGVVDVSVDKPHCLMNGPLGKNVLVINKTNNGVKNVVVWLRPNNPNRAAELTPAEIKPELAKPAPKNHVIDQPCCQFEPRIPGSPGG